MLTILLPSLVVVALVALVTLCVRARTAQLARIDEAPSEDVAPGHGPLPSANVHGGLFDHTANDRRGLENAHPCGYAPNERPMQWMPGAPVGSSVQTTQRTEERVARAGMPADGITPDVITRIAEVALRPGTLGLIGSVAAKAGQGVKAPVAAAAAAVSAFKTNIGSTAGIQTFTGTDFQGAIGTSRLVPARNVVLVLSNHADWDATTAVLTAEDEYGREITENFVIPNGGNVTLTGTKVISKIISFVIPAQTSTGGTATLGTGTLLGPLTSRDVLGILRYLAARMPTDTATEYAANDTLAVIKDGRVWVDVEEAVLDGEQVYTRFVISGDEVVGGFRNDRDGTAAAPDAVPVIGMRFFGNSITDADGALRCRVQCNF